MSTIPKELDLISDVVLNYKPRQWAVRSNWNLFEAEPDQLSNGAVQKDAFGHWWIRQIRMLLDVGKRGL